MSVTETPISAAQATTNIPVHRLLPTEVGFHRFTPSPWPLSTAVDAKCTMWRISLIASTGAKKNTVYRFLDNGCTRPKEKKNVFILQSNITTVTNYWNMHCKRFNQMISRRTYYNAK